jgi:hypothetical protein
VGEWHAQVDATCITAAAMPRPMDRRLAVPCPGGALDESSLLPPLPPEHRSHRSIAPTRASLPLEHRSHWSTAPTGATGMARAKMVRRV